MYLSPPHVIHKPWYFSVMRVFESFSIIFVLDVSVRLSFFYFVILLRIISGLIGFILPSIFVKAAILIDARIQVMEQTEQTSVTNYTVAVVTYLTCHVTVFVLSYVLSQPINSSVFYLPGLYTILPVSSVYILTGVA